MSSVRISPRELETKGGAEATAATLVGAREESLAGDGAPFNGSAATRNVDETEEEQTPLSIHVGKGGRSLGAAYFDSSTSEIKILQCSLHRSSSREKQGASQ